MKSRWLKYLAGLLLVSVVLPLQAANLMDVYYEALHSDPTFKQAEADWQSAKEDLPIARSNLLPRFDIIGNYEKQYKHSPFLPLRVGNGRNYNYGYTLALTQPIFNFPAWNAIKGAKARVKAATATYAAAAQDLMVRTARAYFIVLQAYDQLRYTVARKRAVHEQLLTAKERFKVGLIAITGVYDAQSVYDQTEATKIADQNKLNDAVEKLREITGRHYYRLVGIRRSVPLVKPLPNDIGRWVQVAEHQNYSLRAQAFAVQAARETVKQQSAGWMPQLDFVGQYAQNYNTSLPFVPKTRQETGLAGLRVDFPLIQGGLVTAQTRQARYDYLSQSSQFQFVHRSVVSETRQSFLGVITGIKKIIADVQTIKSAQNALDATKAGYDVGTRTMVDVLDDLTALYLKQQQYSDDQYTYIVDTIELKANAGTLSAPDLEKINAWLTKRVKLNLPKAAYSKKRQSFTEMKPLNLKLKRRRIAKVIKPKPLKKKTTSMHRQAKKQRIKMYKLKRRTKRISVKKPTRLLQPIPPPQAFSQERSLLLPKPRRMTPQLMRIPAPKNTAETPAKQTMSKDDQVIPLYTLSKK